MPQCPNCGTEQKDDYGMVTCPQCKAILFIDMEGLAHTSMTEETPQSPGAPPPEAAPPFQVEPFEPPIQFNSDPVALDHESDQSAVDVVHSQDGRADSDAYASVLPIDPESMNVDQVGGVATYPDERVQTESFEQEYSQGASELQHEAGVYPDFGSFEDPLGLNSYANSELSQAKDGMLLFRVLISGIDTKEVRDSIREALQDSRFGWDTGVLMSSIVNGVLTVEDATPVKAAILINRIKRLSVRVRWEQYAITQMEEP